MQQKSQIQLYYASSCYSESSVEEQTAEVFPFFKLADFDSSHISWSTLSDLMLHLLEPQNILKLPACIQENWEKLN